MTTQPPKGLRFPKRFLWGAATAAHQVEGGLHNNWTVWELENARSLAAQAPYKFRDLDNWSEIAHDAQNSANYVSGKAVDHFRRFEEDFQLLKDLGLSAFRFSIEWSRLEPEEGRWSVEAIDYYRNYLKTMKKMGITPIVTLFHFTLPVWFAEKGGFEKRRNVKYFERFVKKILEELGADISWIISINEPTVYMSEGYVTGDYPPNKTGVALALRVLLNLIYAHRQVYRLTKKNRRWRVSMAHHLIHFYAGDDAWLSRMSARVANYGANTFTVKRVIRQSDFLAVNHYFSHRIYGYRVHDQDDHTSDLGWSLLPSGLQYVLEDLGERYDLPVMVTESGLADTDDSQRKWWISETIKAMDAAMKNGVKLLGYLHWSLLDNFEWNKGFWPKFGLIAVDRRTMKRTVRPSAKWYGAVVRKLNLK